MLWNIWHSPRVGSHEREKYVPKKAEMKKFSDKDSAKALENARENIAVPFAFFFSLADKVP